MVTSEDKAQSHLLSKRGVERQAERPQLTLVSCTQLLRSTRR